MAGTAPKALFSSEAPKQSYRAALKNRAAGELVAIQVNGRPHVCRVEPKQGRRHFVYDFMTDSVRRESGETVTGRLKPSILAMPTSELSAKCRECRRAAIKLEKLREKDFRAQCRDDDPEDPDGAKLSFEIQVAKLELQDAYKALNPDNEAAQNV